MIWSVLNRTPAMGSCRMPAAKKNVMNSRNSGSSVRLPCALVRRELKIWTSVIWSSNAVVVVVVVVVVVASKTMMATDFEKISRFCAMNLRLGIVMAKTQETSLESLEPDKGFYKKIITNQPAVWGIIFARLTRTIPESLAIWVAVFFSFERTDPERPSVRLRPFGTNPSS